MTLGAVRADARLQVPSALFVAAAGCVALAARPPIPWIGFGVTLAVGVAGALALTPTLEERKTRLPVTSLVAMLGIIAFASIRFVSVIPPMRPTWMVGLWLVIAAVAQELFFRRFLYGVLAERGAAVAIAGSAALFALVHIPAYGPGVLPIDLAAGLVLSWQRWATGSWSAPAASHVAANLMAIV